MLNWKYKGNSLYVPNIISIVRVVSKVEGRVPIDRWTDRQREAKRQRKKRELRPRQRPPDWFSKLPINPNCTLLKSSNIRQPLNFEKYRINEAPKEVIITVIKQIDFKIIVIELSGVQLHAWVHNTRSIWTHKHDILQTKIARHEVQLPINYMLLKSFSLSNK